MDSANVDAFFSCSFADEDKSVNEFFYAICEALDIRGGNVSTAFSQTPPEKAKQLISDSQALIAVCTKRTAIGGGNYSMSDAVHDELSFAFGKDIPVLMFVENDVLLAGFKNNFGTHLRFDRDNLCDPEMIKNAVAAIHGIKMDVVSPNDLIIDQDTNEFYAEHHRHLCEMKENGSNYLWTYSSTKRLNFLKAYKRSFTTAYWATVACGGNGDEPPITWELNVDTASRDLHIHETIEKHTPECIEALLKIEPHPVPGDYIEFSTNVSSPYLNPVWDEDVGASSPLHLEAGDFKCFDGLIPIQRTKKLILEFRFPRSYGLKKHEIVPFVGSYTSYVDYEVPSEISRATVDIETYGGNLEVRMEIDSPLLRHVYGIAWNPKKKPT